MFDRVSHVMGLQLDEDIIASSRFISHLFAHQAAIFSLVSFGFLRRKVIMRIFVGAQQILTKGSSAPKRCRTLIEGFHAPIDNRNSAPGRPTRTPILVSLGFTPSPKR